MWTEEGDKQVCQVRSDCADWDFFWNRCTVWKLSPYCLPLSKD